MMRFSGAFFFALFLFLILLIEGIGIGSSRSIAYVGILLFFSFLLFLLMAKQRDIAIVSLPRFFTIFSVLFLIVTSVSAITSVHFVQSFFYCYFYLALFIIFLFFQQQKDIGIYLQKVLFLVAIFFVLCSQLIPFFLDHGFTWLIPSSGFQMVYSLFGSHNHLGDFLLMPMIVSLYKLLKERSKKYLIFLLGFSPFFILSYSRSAYLSFFLVSLALFVKNFSFTKKKIFLIGIQSVLLIITFIFFFITVADTTHFPKITQANTYLKNLTQLQNKGFLAHRDVYFTYAIDAVLERPLLGLGPGNYIYASYSFGTPDRMTTSSHNILLDIFSEEGIVAGVIFLALTLIVLFNSEKNIYFFLLASLFINFQTDYTFQIYSFSLLFVLFAALCYSERENIRIKSSFVLSFVLVYILLLQIFFMLLYTL